MHDDVTRNGYAPYPLDPDPAAFGLVTTSVHNVLGSAVAYHRPERTSTRATIFLHGAAGSWSTWTPLLTAAERADIPIVNPVLVDMPGWGRGTLGADPADRTIETVATLVREVAEALGYTEWDLVGHSMGGFIALHMASVWPQSVLSVGTVSATTWSVIESVAHPVRRFGVLPAFTALWQVMRLLAALGAVGVGLIRGVHRIGLLRTATLPLFRHGYRVGRSVAQSIADDVRPASFAAAAEITRGYDADTRWCGIECPVRAVVGDRDVFVLGSDLERLRRIQPDAVTTVIEDCGHFAQIERPLETLEALGIVAPRLR